MAVFRRLGSIRPSPLTGLMLCLCPRPTCPVALYFIILWNCDLPCYSDSKEIVLSAGLWPGHDLFPWLVFFVRYRDLNSTPRRVFSQRSWHTFEGLFRCLATSPTRLIGRERRSIVDCQSQSDVDPRVQLESSAHPRIGIVRLYTVVYAYLCT